MILINIYIYIYRERERERDTGYRHMGGSTEIYMDITRSREI